MPPPIDDDAIDRLSRRSTLVRAGGLAAVALGASRLATDAEAGEQAALACVLTPEMTEGPYYVDDMKVRRDITEGLPGAPLSLRLSVLDASTCKPIKGAAVDIWHASAGGKYSGERVQRHGRAHLPARDPAHRREGPRALRDRLPGLVPGPCRAHPRQGARRRGRGAHGSAVLPRQHHATRSTSARRTRRAASATMRNADDSIYGDGGSRSLLAMRSGRQGLRRGRSAWASAAADRALRRARASRRRAGCRRGCTPPRVRAGG